MLTILANISNAPLLVKPSSDSLILKQEEIAHGYFPLLLYRKTLTKKPLQYAFSALIFSEFEIHCCLHTIFWFGHIFNFCYITSKLFKNFLICPHGRIIRHQEKYLSTNNRAIRRLFVRAFHVERMNGNWQNEHGPT